MTEAPATRERRTPGRRRDPAKELALKQAALDLYVEAGWSGFSFEAVARKAQVGKPAIYLRWDSREALLLEAMDLLDVPSMSADTGSLGGDLRAMADSLFSWWQSKAAEAWFRLQGDHLVAENMVKAFYNQQVRRNILAARSVVERAIARGEMSSFQDGLVLLEMVNGAILTRMLDTPFESRGRFVAERDAYIERLCRIAERLVEAPL